MTKNGNNLRRDTELYVGLMKSALICSLATELCQLSQTADKVFWSEITSSKLIINVDAYNYQPAIIAHALLSNTNFVEKFLDLV